MTEHKPLEILYAPIFQLTINPVDEYQTVAVVEWHSVKSAREGFDKEFKRWIAENVTKSLFGDKTIKLLSLTDICDKNRELLHKWFGGKQ